MTRTRRGLPPGFSFSLSRATGLSEAKRKLSKASGVPLTRASRQRKLGAAMGCCVVLALPLVGTGLTAAMIFKAYAKDARPIPHIQAR